jgi:hypothetical protein
MCFGEMDAQVRQQPFDVLLDALLSMEADRVHRACRTELQHMRRGRQIVLSLDYPFSED